MSKNSKYNYTFKFNQEQLEYDFQLRKRRKWWWLSLLLLPFLLLIHCRHDVIIRTISPYDVPIANAYVESHYTEYQLLKKGKLFYIEEHNLLGQTDENGFVSFGKQNTSLYSWIFHARTPIESFASKKCVEGNDVSLFHWHCHRHPYLLYMYNCCYDKSGIPVHVVDKETGDDIPKARIKWLAGVEGDAITDEHGFFYIPRASFLTHIDNIDAKAEGYADTIYVNIPIDSIRDSIITIKMRPIDAAFNCDIIMCIDNTNSMDGFINSVRKNIMHFYRDLQSYFKKTDKRMGEVNLRIIEFGDFEDSQLKQSPVYNLPKQSRDLKKYVASIELTGGGDGPEDALEALATALKTSWTDGKTRGREVIIVYTDAPAHKIGTNAHQSFYPKGMPSNFEELSSIWNSMNYKTKRLILFAPKEYPWNNIYKQWDNVDHPTGNLNKVLKGRDYDEIIKTICEFL